MVALCEFSISWVLVSERVAMRAFTGSDLAGCRAYTLGSTDVAFVAFFFFMLHGGTPEYTTLQLQRINTALLSV